MPKVTYTPAKGLVQEAGSGVNITGNISSNYLRFISGDWFGMTLSTLADTAVDSGFTMADGTIYQAAWDGGGAAALVLPEAKAGALTVLRLTAQADGGANLTVTTASGDYYAGQSLNTDVVNLGDGLMTHNRILGNDWTDTVATGGGAIVTANGTTHNRFTLAATATNNQSNIGAELAFFCHEDGYWRMSWLASELGSGALNGTFAFSAV